ncbi:hypothetical protein CY34DRAFT_814165 [Suillus luteus UH-Slu-Lm8-n1]|uniref:WD40 repeat-like protein n=1 Tax=Suillus luteus UH-Slu-Lm8-n1 TaxID=930992 RepID=A0A0C9Z5D6_9AGAM|nr:hypothetical protein CY34DRAFT_814165 [Suillus luteus UH-Slu-Lm8-n1]
MDAPTMHNSLATMPLRKTKVDGLRDILCLPDGKRIIVYSLYAGSFRVMDLETGTQVGEEWEEKDGEVRTMVLSPDGKKVASGGTDRAVKLWSVDTGKVIKTWTGHTNWATFVSWSQDGGRVVSASDDGTFRVWDVKSGKTILGPINTGIDTDVRAVCHSPDAKMIATALGSRGLKIWDANSGELLKTLQRVYWCLAWTSDGKTLIAGGSKIDTATWTVVDLCKIYVNAISVSPNDRILATTSFSKKTAQLWDLETNQPIGTPLHHQDDVYSARFSVDGKFLLTCCDDDHIYTWDVSAIVKRAGLPSDILDVTPRSAPKIKGARIPPGFFDDALREANLRIRLSQSHAPPTPTPHQRTFNPLSSVWRSSEPHGATDSATQSRSQPFSWARNLSGILRRRDVPATLPLPSSLSAQPTARVDHFEIGTPPPPSSGVVQSLRQHLSFLVPRHNHGPPVVEVAPGRKFTRLAAAKLPEYKKVDDTRHPSSQHGAVPQENDTADADSLPDVHWCKAFLCFCSCLSHGRLRMPPRWRLERVDIPRQDGAANSNSGGAHRS